MFYDEVERGLAANETSISHDEALKIISGGLVQFLCDFKYNGDMDRCEKQLFCIAKATNALNADDKKVYIALLGFLASMDAYSRDWNYISDKVSEAIGIDKKDLSYAIEIIRDL